MEETTSVSLDVEACRQRGIRCSSPGLVDQIEYQEPIALVPGYNDSRRRGKNTLEDSLDVVWACKPLNSAGETSPNEVGVYQSISQVNFLGQHVSNRSAWQCLAVSTKFVPPSTRI